MIAWAIEALIASTALMALVLLVRGHVRRLFGAGVAYALWSLPLLRLLLPPLPAEWREAAATPISQASETITVLMLDPAGRAANTAVSASSPASAPVASMLPSVGLALALAWAVGAALFLGWHATRHARFCRRLLNGAAPMGRHGAIHVVESPAAPGPLAFGIWRRYVAFPRDFAERYDHDERDLALAHELGHHARGDLVANWTALVVLALHWFNPIAWRAFHAFRADQELANDARVLAGRSAVDRHAYACAIVKTAHGGALSAACHLHAVDDLKGRLKMLTTSRHSRGRIAAGAASVGVIVLAGLGLTASGTQAAERIRTATGIDLEQVEASIAPQAAPSATASPVSGAPVDAVAVTSPTARAVRKDVRRVVVVKDGERTVYEGADADAYVAANPLPPLPAVPPMPASAATPPLPPLPPLPMTDATGRTRVIVRDRTGAVRTRDFGGHIRPSDIPQVASMNCPGDAARPMVLQQRSGSQRRIIICTNRIQAAQARAEQSRAQAAATRHQALSSALASLQATRASMLANRDMAEWERKEVAESIEDSIDEVREEMRSPD